MLLCSKATNKQNIYSHMLTWWIQYTPYSLQVTNTTQNNIQWSRETTCSTHTHNIYQPLDTSQNSNLLDQYNTYA